MTSKNLMMKNKINGKNDSMLNSTIRNNKNNSSLELPVNKKIPISINKKIKSIFKYALNEIGIDIMNPKNFINELLNMYLQEENLTQETMEYRTRVETFVKTFIFLLVNWKFSLIEKTFDVKENILKLLLKKQIFKCNYLSNSTIDEYLKNENISNSTIDEYLKNENIMMQNLYIIFNVIKSIEYKYSIKIVGIESYQQKSSNDYSLEVKFHWFIKFVDYIILLYLSEDSIVPFSYFINGKKMGELVETFDKEKNFNLSYFFFQENKETL